MSDLLLQLDGSTPNLALMRIAAHLRSKGRTVELRQLRRKESVHPTFDRYENVYASAIFERTRPLCRRLLEIYPNAIIGGSGWDEEITVADVGVPATTTPDYFDYPACPHSIGFTQRGCRLKCPFCKVPRMEGKVVKVATCWDIWRGDPWPRNLLLLDNDFFGQKDWRKEIEAIREGGFKVSFNQGFNVRLIDDEAAAAIASVDYRDNEFKDKRLYTAWDNRKDEKLLFTNLEALVRHGVKPDEILVYMLIGFWDGPQLTPDDFYRHAKLREFGCRPYPMPFVRNKELIGFQRWIVRRIDCNVPWEEFTRAKYRPEKVGVIDDDPLFARTQP
jgi:hypothetical protein